MIREFFHKHHTYIFGTLTILIIFVIAFFLDRKLKQIESDKAKEISIVQSENVSLKKTIKQLNDSISFYNDTLNRVIQKQEFYQNLYEMEWENICFFIDLFKIKHPDIVKAQILLETNYLKSNVCIINRNLFGMRHVNGRLSLGTYNYHALYSSYVESLMEYKLWQDMYYKDDNESYFSFLYRMGYSTDKLYNYKLRQIMKNEKFKDLNNFN